MDPSNNTERGHMNLPAPLPEAAPGQPPAGVAGQSQEALPSAPESQPGTAQPGQGGQAALPAFMQPSSSAIPQINDDSATTASAVPNATDTTDLIDKESVQKAKQILDTYREDPYTQSKELNNFRADYMKQNYNKIIKLSE